MSFRRPAETTAAAGPGSRAIDRRVDRIDGSPEHHRYHPRAPHRFQGGGPLREVTTHRLRRPDHWHLVTYGLSELDGKESDDPLLSGWGFELTFRLAAGPDGVTASGGAAPDPPDRDRSGRTRRRAAPDAADATDPEPLWAVDLLTNLAAYVWTSGHPFAPGHHLDLGGPIRIGGGGELTAAVIVTDPTLGAMKGPYGLVEFLQVVALTADELELCRSWSTDGVVDLLRAQDPLLVTSLPRRSVLADGSVATEVAARAERDGSSLTELRVASLRSKARPLGGAVVTLGAGASAALGPALRRELVAEGASFRLIGDDSDVRFVVGTEAAWRFGTGRIEVTTPLDEVAGLAALFDGRTGWGHRPAWDKLRWRVVP